MKTFSTTTAFGLAKRLLASLLQRAEDACRPKRDRVARMYTEKVLTSLRTVRALHQKNADVTSVKIDLRPGLTSKIELGKSLTIIRVTGRRLPSALHLADLIRRNLDKMFPHRKSGIRACNGIMKQTSTEAGY